jgi:voltage-gated sodium channel
MKIAHARLKSWVHSKEFCHAVNYAIIAFAVVLGLETFRVSERWMELFSTLDYFFLIFFTIEILLRILIEDHPIDFFNLFKTRKRIVEGRKKTEFEITEHGVWNYFDFILILMSIIGVFGNLFVFPGFFQVGRLFRIFRIVRLLEISDHLKEVEKRIVSIVPTVFSFAVLLLILTYIYSIMGMFMFEKKVFESANFSTITDSFISLFQVMTLDNWSDVMKDLRANVQTFPPLVIEFYFISFVIFTAIIAFNVFIAVMTSQVQEKLEKDIEEKITDDQSEQKELSSHLQAMVEEIRNLRTEIIELKKKVNE